MNEPHVSPEELGAIAGLPSEHERRRHVESCPRCRALWMDYQSFLEETPLPPEAGAADARAALRATIRREVGPRDAPIPLPPRRALRIGPTSRGLLAAAAGVVVVATGMWWMTGRAPRDVVRGPSVSLTSPLAIQPAEALGDSSIVLRWRSHPAAQRYEVRLYGADMTERLRIDAATDSVLELRRDRIPAELRDEAQIGWRVVALRDGAELGRSAFGTFRGR